MQKTITLGTHKLKLNACMGWLLIYKQTFISDPLQSLYDFLEQREGQPNAQYSDLGEAGTVFLMRTIWSMAYAYDPNVPDAQVFYLDIDHEDLELVFEDIIYLLNASMATLTKNKYEAVGHQGSDGNLDDIILSALSMGFSFSDLKQITLGRMIDLVTTRNNRQHESTGPIEYVRIADQSDFDRFTGG